MTDYQWRFIPDTLRTTELDAISSPWRDISEGEWTIDTGEMFGGDDAAIEFREKPSIDAEEATRLLATHINQLGQSNTHVKEAWDVLLHDMADLRRQLAAAIGAPTTLNEWNH